MRRLEQELRVREFEVVEREIQVMILQQEARSQPPLRKRTGPVRRKLLDKYRSTSAQYISPPIGMHARCFCPISTLYKRPSSG